MTSVLVADCLIAMAMMAAESVDAVVTDPPYHLTQASRRGSARTEGTGPFGRHRVGSKGFMGKTWDGGGVAFRVELWEAVLRLLKPGARLLAFGGTRTYHRMAVAIEDAGFEIEDSLCWLYGSGFPKHPSKLKPAFEPVVMARRPAERATALNIADCRIGTDDTRQVKRGGRNDFPHEDDSWEPRPIIGGSANGRWPANVVCDEEAARLVDEQSGTLQSNSGTPFTRNTDKFRATYSAFVGRDAEAGYYGDTGGASRFYYTAKASRSEREEGLEGAARKAGGSLSHTTSSLGTKDGRNAPRGNHHPTVKPVSLMRWLVRLVTPPNGVVLDPFCGSGTTGIAAFLEDRRFTGIEVSPEYAEIARARIAHASRQPSLFAEMAV